MVLTHMSNRVYATFAYLFTVAESIFAIAGSLQVIRIFAISLACFTPALTARLGCGRFYIYRDATRVEAENGARY